MLGEQGCMTQERDTLLELVGGKKARHAGQLSYRHQGSFDKHLQRVMEERRTPW